MRQLLLSLTACFFFVHADAQNIRVADLFRMHEMDAEQIESFALRSGFDIAKKIPSANNTEIQNYSRTKNHVYQNLGISVIAETFVFKTSYLTRSSKEYASLKEQIKQLGYTSYKTISNEKVGVQIYKKRNSKYSIRTSANYNEDTNSTFYFLYVADDPKMEEILGGTNF